MSIEQLTSINLVTYNRIDLTKQTILDLLKTTKSNFELIIVDNGSQDNTVEYLQEIEKDLFNNPYLKSFKLKKNDNNRGIAIGRNQGLQMSDGDFVVTLDNDILLPDNWLSQCIKILSENPNYGAVGVNFEGVNYPLVTDKNGFSWQEKPKGNLGTACMVFNRSLNKLLGFFNAVDYSPFYGLEDSDFGMRIRCLGLKLGYIKENGIHLGGNEDPNDSYRKFKTECHDSYIKKFNENCAAYANKRKSLYIPFKE